MIFKPFIEHHKSYIANQTSRIHFFPQSFYPWVFQVFVKGGEAVYDAFGG